VPLRPRLRSATGEPSGRTARDQAPASPGKGGKVRYLPVHPVAADRIHAYLERSGHARSDSKGPLFIPLRHWAKGLGVTASGIYTLVEAYAKKAVSRSRDWASMACGQKQSVVRPTCTASATCRNFEIPTHQGKLTYESYAGALPHALDTSLFTLVIFLFQTIS